MEGESPGPPGCPPRLLQGWTLDLRRRHRRHHPRSRHRRPGRSAPLHHRDVTRGGRFRQLPSSSSRNLSTVPFGVATSTREPSKKHSKALSRAAPVAGRLLAAESTTSAPALNRSTTRRSSTTISRRNGPPRSPLTLSPSGLLAAGPSPSRPTAGNCSACASIPPPATSTASQSQSADPEQLPVFGPQYIFRGNQAGYPRTRTSPRRGTQSHPRRSDAVNPAREILSSSPSVRLPLPAGARAP